MVNFLNHHILNSLNTPGCYKIHPHTKIVLLYVQKPLVHTVLQYLSYLMPVRVMHLLRIFLLYVINIGVCGQSNLDNNYNDG